MAGSKRFALGKRGDKNLEENPGLCDVSGRRARTNLTGSARRGERDGSGGALTNGCRRQASEMIFWIFPGQKNQGFFFYGLWWVLGVGG